MAGHDGEREDAGEPLDRGADGLLKALPRGARTKGPEDASGEPFLADEVNDALNGLQASLGVDDVNSLVQTIHLAVNFEGEGDPGVEVDGDVADLLCFVLIFHTISI